MSEAAKYKDLFIKYCYRSDGEPGCGADIGSQGFCTVPWAIQLDLPPAEFSGYCGGANQHGPIQLRGRAEKLPFDSQSLDYLLASHVLEDFEDWLPVLKEWVRVLKPSGHLIVLLPEKGLWEQAVSNGQPPNRAHRHEGKVGELSKQSDWLGVETVEDRLTNCFPGDYTILFVARRC